MRILANDGVSASGIKLLESNGFEVVTEKVPQDQLAQGINDGRFVGVLVRSATQVRQEHIDACPNLKLIGRGGVGMDNIDVDYARSKGLHVINTPGASAQSVAELALANMFAMARFTFDAARKMPVTGHDTFKALKKSYSKGCDLRGKSLGIIGFGGIGRELAKYAIGCGMNVNYYTHSNGGSHKISINIAGQSVEVEVFKKEFDDLIASSDFISLHVPKQPGGKAIIGHEELARMKKGAFLVNTARGGIIDESALLAALDNGQIGGVALDVFVNEPTPRTDLLQHPLVLSTPHVGGSTVEAQDRIGEELADQIISLLK